MKTCISQSGNHHGLGRVDERTIYLVGSNFSATLFKCETRLISRPEFSLSLARFWFRGLGLIVASTRTRMLEKVAATDLTLPDYKY